MESLLAMDMVVAEGEERGGGRSMVDREHRRPYIVSPFIPNSMKSRLGIFHHLPGSARLLRPTPGPSSCLASSSLPTRHSTLSFMSDNPSLEQAAPNSLGLDLEALKIKDDPDLVDAKPSADAPTVQEDASKSPEAAVEDNANDDAAGKKDPKDKKKPYVNPDRVKTGGAQRVRVRRCERRASR